MKEMQYEKWLKSLKVGDEVAYQTGPRGEEHYITKVVRITKLFIDTGRIGRWRLKDGFEVGKYSSTRRQIKPVTEKIRRGERARDMRSRIRFGTYAVDSWTDDEVLEVADLYEKIEAKHRVA